MRSTTCWVCHRTRSQPAPTTVGRTARPAAPRIWREPTELAGAPHPTLDEDPRARASRLRDPESASLHLLDVERCISPAGHARPKVGRPLPQARPGTDVGGNLGSHAPQLRGVRGTGYSYACRHLPCSAAQDGWWCAHRTQPGEPSCLVDRHLQPVTRNLTPLKRLLAQPSVPSTSPVSAKATTRFAVISSRSPRSMASRSSSSNASSKSGVPCCMSTFTASQTRSKVLSSA